MKKYNEDTGWSYSFEEVSIRLKSTDFSDYHFFEKFNYLGSINATIIGKYNYKTYITQIEDIRYQNESILNKLKTEALIRCENRFDSKMDKA